MSRRAGGPGGALRQWEMHFGPNMTPMVDVVMVILIFFMAGTAVIAPELFLAAGLPADPSVQDAPGPTPRDAFELPAARFTRRLWRRSGRTVIDGLGTWSMNSRPGRSPCSSSRIPTCRSATWWRCTTEWRLRVFRGSACSNHRRASPRSRP
ncbi:MAG: biopolymer transporter ExbD [Planctomycetes bacterium]|nr:biopolymer transporter ExbD [Planctomycetota bacterium]